VLGVRFDSVCECVSARELLSVVAEPYDSLVPYSTCPSAASPVVHVTVSDVLLTDVATMAETAGGVVSVAAAVAKLWPHELDVLPYRSVALMQ
jgi:hypothetical protein